MLHGDICPSCGKKVTIGVLHRVEALADQPEGRIPPGAPSFSSIVPLVEVLGEVLQTGAASKKVSQAYFDLLGKLGSEFSILLDIPVDKISRTGHPLVASAIRRMRLGEVSIEPGFVGRFGQVRLMDE
jgi:PHP family Zn ribbon phosphoesterase